MVSIAVPIITVLSNSVNKISRISSKDYCAVTFSADQDLTQWVARANSADHASGSLVGTGELLPHGEIANFYVYGKDLNLGDIEYQIKVYGKNADGVWSDDKLPDVILPTAVKIDYSSLLTVKVASVTPMTATVTPSNATSKLITWNSSDPTILKATSTGDTEVSLKALKAGLITLKATTTNGLSHTITVRVNA